MPDLSSKAMAALVLLAAIAFAVSPLLTEPFSGFDPSQLPRPVDDPPIQPAGYAFAIWGVIYVWLIISAAYGLLSRAVAPDWQPMRAPLLLSLVIGASWIPVALSAPVTSTVLILAMLVTALIALFNAPASQSALAAAPIALYAGWLSAAAIVASATIIAAYTGLSTTIVSIGGLIVIGAVATLVIRATAHPLPYAAAVLWALIGVVVANTPNGATLPLGTTITVIAILSSQTLQRLRQ
ncbi:tryptophan-rich sensory protein [Rhodobacteraceae bacterium M385]|nr:tryptophan-rich sensory protein [Rhodobacteraceae bacterium M385]